MTRRIGLLVIVISLAISIWWGFLIARNVPGGPLDFQAVYYGTKCLLRHDNPYNVHQLEALYRSEGGEHDSDSAQRRQTVTLYVNLPATFVYLAPLATLPLSAAQLIWAVLAGGGLITASYLMWDFGTKYSSIVSCILIAIFLANCELIFLTGNTVGIVISLCTIGVWCLIRSRFVVAGVVFMGIALSIKPHDVGFVWLTFLMVGGEFRKRALQSLAFAAAVALLGVIWVTFVVPHWIQDWSMNMQAISAPGGLNSPGPQSLAINILGSVVSLQSVFALIHDQPAFYNTLTYLLCGVMLVIWIVRTIRLGSSRPQVWLALAAVSPITLIVTYHRSYDAKLLLLTFPACIMLWTMGGVINRAAMAVNVVVLLLTADFPLTILMTWAKDLHLGNGGLLEQLGTIIMMRPAPFALLGMSLFYLWVYCCRSIPSAYVSPDWQNHSENAVVLPQAAGTLR